MGIKIAAQLFTVREFMKTPEDMKESLKRIKKIGYNAAQVSGIGPIDPTEFKKLSDEAGITICATHIGFDSIENDIESVIEKHKVWDCKYVGIGAMPANLRNEAGYYEFAKRAEAAGRKLKENGLELIYHNHNFEFERFGNKTGLDIIFENSDPEYVGFEIDTYWVQAGGCNPVDWINKVKGRMKVVHFKDFAYNKDTKYIFTEIGNGNLNWGAIIDACNNTDVEWAAIEQDICPGDPFESLKISHDFLADKFNCEF